MKSILQILAQEEPIPRIISETAAVAVILREAPEGEEVLLIKRADREGDPWSGQIALPGGRVQKQDDGFRATAVRETREEVGIDLDKNASFIGYMGAFQARTRSILVVPSVFVAKGSLDAVPNSEVSSYRWVSFRDVLALANRSTYEHKVGTATKRFPAFKFEDYLVWGLTERILSALIDASSSGA